MRYMAVTDGVAINDDIQKRQCTKETQIVSLRSNLAVASGSALPTFDGFVIRRHRALLSHNG
jgi:hypothetical protein